MKKIGIVADSHSSISQELARELGIRVLPMPFYIDGKCYHEGVDLTRETFFQELAAGTKLSTSQASPEELFGIWDEALEEYEKILYMPISSGLSGSVNTAKVLAAEEKYAGRVLVVDNGRVSTPMHCTILDALQMIEKGWTAEQIRDTLEATRNDEVIYLAVNTLQYLKAGGRISGATAAVGTLLNIKPVLKLDTGVLRAWKNCRGINAAKKLMIETVKNDLATRFKKNCESGRFYLMTATSATPEENAAWIEEVKAAFPGMDVLSDYLSLGVCCHSGPGALGIGVSAQPDF